MCTLFETLTKRIINMYFLVLKIFPQSKFVITSRLTVTACTAVSSQEAERIELAREAKINWGAELSRNLPVSSNSIFAIP